MGRVQSVDGGEINKEDSERFIGEFADEDLWSASELGDADGSKEPWWVEVKL